MKKKHDKIIPFFKYLAFAMALITIITLCLFKFIDVLPIEYYLLLCGLLISFDLIFTMLILTKRGVKRRIFGTIMSLIYIALVILMIVYELNTLGFLKKLGYQNYKTENYSLLVLKDSKSKSIEDLQNTTIGSLPLNTEGGKDAKNKITNKITVEFKTYEDISNLKNDFLNKTVSSMLIENSLLTILNENDEDFVNSYEVIYEFSIDIETKDISNSVDITKNSFNVYISGIDTYGSVSSVSRSDVNMIISVNPKTNKILITSIPRDYYVSLYGKNAKDKLTHAGIYGIETSVKTIEELLNIKINYYLKVNFTSLINIVDKLEGVNVYSKYSFTSKDGYYYQKGNNYVDGKKALSFVRERKAFSAGDRVRGENQAAMIEAMIDKAISPSIITKYNSLLKTLSKAFVTNLKTEEITEFIKFQIDSNPKWDITTYSLDGTNGFDYTYSYGSLKSYVMIPDSNTIINAQNKIKEVLAN